MHRYIARRAESNSAHKRSIAKRSRANRRGYNIRSVYRHADSRDPVASLHRIAERMGRGHRCVPANAAEGINRKRIYTSRVERG